jgi:hypothetical protein
VAHIRRGLASYHLVHVVCEGGSLITWGQLWTGGGDLLVLRLAVAGDVSLMSAMDAASSCPRNVVVGEVGLLQFSPYGFPSKPCVVFHRVLVVSVDGTALVMLCHSVALWLSTRNASTLACKAIRL